MSIADIATISFVVLVIVGYFVLKVYNKYISLKKRNKDLEFDLTQARNKPQRAYLNELPLPPQATYCTHSWDVVSDKVIEVEDRKSHMVILKCPLCGVTDKTVNTVEKDPPPIPVAECRHKWKEKVKAELPSAYEQLQETLVFLEKSYGTAGKKKIRDSIANKIDNHENDGMLFRKAIVRVYECTKCGKLYEVKGANYDPDKDVDGCNSCD